MEAGQYTPHQLADWRVIIAGAIGTRTTQLQDILQQKPGIWQKMRSNHKSVADTDREWEATDMGIQENWLKLEIKKLEKMSSAIRTSLEVANTEARNVF